MSINDYKETRNDEKSDKYNGDKQHSSSHLSILHHHLSIDHRVNIVKAKTKKSSVRP